MRKRISMVIIMGLIVCLIHLALAGPAGALSCSCGPFIPGTGNWTIVSNGDFSNGLTGWLNEDPHNRGSFAISDEYAISGDTSAKAIPSESFEGWGFALYKSVSVTPNQEYVLSGFFVRDCHASLYLDLADASFEKTVAASIPYSTNWQFCWDYFTVPPDVNQVNLRLCYDGIVYLAEHGYFDDVAITPANEFEPPLGVNPLDVGLVGYWSFDEGEGEIAHDKSGNGNDGTIHEANWAIGAKGNALSFDGVNDFVQVANPNSLNFGSTIDFTMMAWIKAENFQQLYPSLISRRDPPTYTEWPPNDPDWIPIGNNGYLLFLWNDPALPGHDGNLSGEMSDGAFQGQINYLSNSGNLFDDTWHHVAMTGDRDHYLKVTVQALGA